MHNEHDDDLAPTVEQRGDLEAEGFSEREGDVRDEERVEPVSANDSADSDDSDDSADDAGDDDIVGK